MAVAAPLHLTSALEDYLETIYQLDRANKVSPDMLRAALARDDSPLVGLSLIVYQGGIGELMRSRARSGEGDAA